MQSKFKSIIHSLNDGSDLQIQISDGLTNLKRSIIWQTAILKQASANSIELIEWAEKAHSLSKELFISMVNEKLYASFKG